MTTTNYATNDKYAFRYNQGVEAGLIAARLYTPSRVWTLKDEMNRRCMKLIEGNTVTQRRAWLAGFFSNVTA